MEKELSGLIKAFKRAFGIHAPYKVPDLILPPMSTTKAAKSSEESKIGVKPSISDINQLPEVKINPEEFNEKNKN